VGNTVGSLSEAQHHAAKTHVTASASDPVTTEAARHKSMAATIRRPLLWVREGEDIVCTTGNGGDMCDVGSSHPGAGAGPKG
jgi:hypothetical protein